MLCNVPGVILPDEPTNNLDLQNIGILIQTLRDYKLTVMVASHDESLIGIGIKRTLDL